MEITLSQEGIEEIGKLTFTTMLTNEKLACKFGLKKKQLAEIRKRCEIQNLTLRDFVWGALITQPDSSVIDISNYIDYKNHDHVENAEIERTLFQLNQDGLAYIKGNNWNFIDRLLEFYDNSTERFVGEISLINFNLSKMKKYFKPKSTDPLMYDVFDINSSNYKIIDGMASLKFDFEKYSYHLTCRQGENAI